MIQVFNIVMSESKDDGYWHLLTDEEFDEVEKLATDPDKNYNEICELLEKYAGKDERRFFTQWWVTEKLKMKPFTVNRILHIPTY